MLSGFWWDVSCLILFFVVPSCFRIVPELWFTVHSWIILVSQYCLLDLFPSDENPKVRKRELGTFAKLFASYLFKMKNMAFAALTEKNARRQFFCHRKLQSISFTLPVSTTCAGPGISQWRIEIYQRKRIGYETSFKAFVKKYRLFFLPPIMWVQLLFFMCKTNAHSYGATGLSKPHVYCCPRLKQFSLNIR